MNETRRRKRPTRIRHPEPTGSTTAIGFGMPPVMRDHATTTSASDAEKPGTGTEIAGRIAGQMTTGEMMT